MHVTIPCTHCGRPLNAPRELLGRVVRCSYCNGEFVLPVLVPGPDSPRPGRGNDRTVSRSMLIKIPNARPALGPGTGDAVVCRLEPGTLRVVQASAAFLEFVGPIEPGRKPALLDFLHDDDRALAETEFRQAIEVGERHDFVLRVRRVDGEWRSMRIFTQARYQPDGAIDHVRCFFKDVTDRVQADQELRLRTEQLTEANERLRQTNQKLREAQGQLIHSEKLAALGTLAAGMAHEINNPLAFATNNVAVLGRDLAALLEILGQYQAAWPVIRQADPATASALAALGEGTDLPYLRDNLPRLVDSTRRGLARVAEIVKNLRAFANLDRAEVGEVDVNESIEQGLSLLGDLLARRRTVVVRDFAELPALEGAPAHLNQVFFHLLMNAMQAVEAAGRPEGKIRVTTRATEGGWVVVEVADDGCGIAPEALSRIFDPFFTTKPIGQGSGLGLSLGHGIVADHGGSIEVDSTLGEGTTFRVRLPSRREGKSHKDPG